MQNNLIKQINAGSIKQNQIEQSILSLRGNVDEALAYRDMVNAAVSANPNHPMLHRPIRAMGESEMRLPDSAYFRGDPEARSAAASIAATPKQRLDFSEYMARRHILGTRVQWAYDDIMRANGLRPATANEEAEAIELRNMQYLLGLDAHHFEIGENFYKLLEPIMGNIKAEEIRLPYEWSVFHLKYHVEEGISDKPTIVVMHQDPETKELTVHPLMGDTAVNPDSLYVKEAMAVCIALDAEIVGKTTIAADLGRPTKKDSIARRTFKILRLKTSAKFISNIHNVNTGRKATALHFRRGHWVRRKGKTFWRRSTIVGKIEYGVVEKVYSV